VLPPDINAGLRAAWTRPETDATGRAVLGTMIKNIKVAGGDR